jgi:hypothetical protein
MRYLVRTLVGVLLIAGSVALASVVIYDLVRIGSCGSDGTYIAVRPCPDGTGLKILGLIVSIFVAPFAGMGLLATRHAGDAQRGPAAVSVGVLWFFLLFTCMGAASLVAGRGPAAPESPGLRSAGTWIGVTFLVMGAPVLLFMVWRTLRAPAPRTVPPALPGRPLSTTPAPRTGPTASPKTAGMATLATQLETIARMRGVTPAPAPAHGADDAEHVAARLRELDELRASGLVTDEEHAAKRRQILADL